MKAFKLVQVPFLVLAVLVGLAVGGSVSFVSAQYPPKPEPITAYSVTNITRVKNTSDFYAATLSITNSPKVPKPGERILHNGDTVNITTTGCAYAPAKGETGIITGRAGSAARTLLFSGGTSCAVTNIVPVN